MYVNGLHKMSILSIHFRPFAFSYILSCFFFSSSIFSNCLKIQVTRRNSAKIFWVAVVRVLCHCVSFSRLITRERGWPQMQKTPVEIANSMVSSMSMQKPSKVTASKASTEAFAPPAFVFSSIEDYILVSTTRSNPLFWLKILPGYTLSSSAGLLRSPLDL